MPAYRRYEAEDDSERRLLNMQMEALGLSRRELVTTQSFPEEKREYVPSTSIRRRVDVAGTKENRAIQGDVKSKLAAWGTAWTSLQDDGTADEDLGDVNEGLGQTHRRKLQEDDSVHRYTCDDHTSGRIFQGGRGGRGVQGQRGRGGGMAGRASGRPPPTKRGRVVREIRDTTPLEKPVRLPPIKTSSKANEQSNSTASVNRLAAIKASPKVNKAKSTDTTRVKIGGVSHTVSVASSSLLGSLGQTRGRLERRSSSSSIRSGLSSTKRKVDYNGELAGPEAFMSSILARKARITTPAPPAVADESHDDVDLMDATSKPQIPPPVITKTSHNDLNLMDLDDVEEVPTQPVIGFTHQQSDNSKMEQISASPVATIGRGRHSPPLRPAAGEADFLKAYMILKEKGTLSADAATLLEHVVDKMVIQENDSPPPKASESVSEGKRDEAPTLPSTDSAIVSPLPKVADQESKQQSGSIALALQAKREALICSHIHRSRFERPRKAVTNPFGPQPERTEPTLPPPPANAPARPQRARAGPPMPPHLANALAVKDPGAAARQQCERSNTSPAGNNEGFPQNPMMKLVRKGPPSLPSHLANMPGVHDSGAAARQQYGTVDSSVTNSERFILNDVNNQPPSNARKGQPPKAKGSMLNRTGFIGLAENDSKGAA